MSYVIRLDDRAINEADEAYRYYEEKQAGLGDRFKDELNECMHYIQNNPYQFKKVKGQIREAVIKTFPYIIVYKVVKEIIIVGAVFHTSQNPKKKFNND